MKKIIIAFIAILIVCTGCFSSETREEKEKREIREKALPIAKKCIGTKYNFSLVDNEIDNYEYLCNSNCDSGYNGNVNIKAHHNGIKYKIEVQTSLEKCRDGYQKEEVIDAIKDYFSNYLNIDKEDFTIYVFKADFLYENIITSFDKLESLLGYYTKFIFITHKPIEEDNVKKLINSFQKSRFNYQLFETKDIETYSDFISKIKLEKDEYKVDYDFKVDNEFLLNKYYTYENDISGGRILDKKEFN